MATLQYIGARYVPKFFDGADNAAWQPNIEYEPLTIVTYLGNSWTSKKTVPSSVGAPNLNLDYWVNTGNFNEQVQELFETISQVSGEVNNIQIELNDVNNDIESIFPFIKQNIATDIKANFLGLFDDFTTQIGSIAKYGDRLWTVNGVSVVSGTTKQSNIGRIIEWSFSNGTKINDISIKTGHANSCCYNPNNNCLYIAPTWDYETEGRPSANYIYKVNTSSYTEEKISTGTVNALGLAYDYVTDTMYLMGYNNILYTYDINNNTITEYVDLSDIGVNNISGALMQDIAIHNDIMLWTTARNQCSEFDIENKRLIKTVNIDTVDSNNIFNMGESEGLNYDNNGHLMISFIKNNSPNVTKHSIDNYTYRGSTNFICEIPTKYTMPYNKFFLPDFIVNQTFTVLDNYSNWHLPNAYTLNTIHQFNCLVSKPKRLSLGSDFTGTNHNPRISIFDEVILNLNGHRLTGFNGFGISGGKLTIEGTGEIEMISNYDEVFYAGRGGLTLAASANITLENIVNKNSSFINAGSTSQMITDFATVTADAPLKINTEERERFAVYVGARKIIDPA